MHVIRTKNNEILVSMMQENIQILDQIRAYEKYQTLGEASKCDAKKQLQCLECCSLNL